MVRVDRSALVMHSAEQMFDLVNNVEAYPRFLPWCASAEVVSVDETAMEARLNVAKAGFKYSFVTRNELHRPERISMSLVEGPFSELQGEWVFTALNDEACKVSLQLEFDFTGRLTGLAMSKVFNQIAVAMVDAFCVEADKVYD